MTILLFTAMMTVSCSPLPKGEDKVKSQWDSFDAAKQSYDSIIINKTNITQLQHLGFDPYSTPNVKILSYLDVIRRFNPNNAVRQEELPPSVRTCILARDACIAYEATPGINKSERVGNVFMDLLNFKRKSIETGWEFNALIVIDHDIVVYKIWSGVPIIDKEKSRNNPLGPFQESVGSAVRSTTLE